MGYQIRLSSVLLLIAVSASGFSCFAQDGATASPMESAESQIHVAEAIASDSTDREVFERLMSRAASRNLAARPLGEIMQAVGQEFLGAEYVGGMLDIPEKEQLVISLSRFDCVLFVETVLAASQGIAEGDTSFADFAVRIRNLRYRGGTIDGYCSRLHYFSDWIRDNESRGNVRNLTAELGGRLMDDSPNFMSRNRNLYPRFAKNDSLFDGIRKMEASLSATPIYYIPQDSIAAVYSHLMPGDILAISTSVGGLDVSHTGLAFDNGDGTFGFLHASTTGGVKISPDLSGYVLGNSKQTGIVVVRPTDSREH
ncbi:MAG: DUF1460 domain-containing protein [Rhodothermales bacterium]